MRDKIVAKFEMYLREFVYGGMDGAVTTFAVVTGAAGGGLSSRIILILGFANVLADGFSMAVGSYLSEKSDQQLSVHKGDSKKEDHESPLAASIVTFLAFVVVGFIPLSVYTFDYAFTMGIDNVLQISIILTLITFALVGYVRGRVARVNPWRTLIESFGLGGIAALISYVVGNLLEKVIS